MFTEAVSAGVMALIATWMISQWLDAVLAPGDSSNLIPSP